MEPRKYCYVLDENREPRPATEAERTRWFEENDKHVDTTTLHTPVDTVMISTVFVSKQDSVAMYEGTVFFETLVFGGRLDQWRARYRTWADAEVGHKFFVAGMKALYPGVDARRA